jgi:hypothetical protein
MKNDFWFTAAAIGCGLMTVALTVALMVALEFR